MKNQTPNSVIVFSALILGSVVSLVVGALNYLVIGKSNLGVPLVTFVFTFVLCWLILQYVIREYIIEKIRLIYKTIHQSKVESAQSLDLRKNVFSDLDKEVQEWAKFNREEIAQLRRLEIYRKEFLGNVSHELKTPIFNIQGYILTLLEGGLEDPTINRDYLQRAENSVERMISIVEDLETISSLESGQLQLDMIRFDIMELLVEVIREQELNASQKKIKLILEDTRPVFVKADRFRIHQVLSNLVTNSIRYGKEDGSTVFRTFDLEDHILVEVEDNGIGIEKTELSRIFERFYRVDSSRSRDSGGTGLGLSIVKHILDAHGQTINVRSNVGQGSVFSFTLKKA